MRPLGKKIKNKIRIIFQTVFILLILYVGIRPLIDKEYLADFEKFCPFGGISSFFSKINMGSMACNMSETQVILGLGLVLCVGLIGKLFCSYVCPIGTVTEWLGKIGERLKIRKDLSGVADRSMRSLKYILLFITIYFTMTSSELFCKSFDPYYAAVNLFDNTDIILLYAIPAFIITVLGALFFRLFWCKYLCPLGALSNIFLNPAAAAGVIIIFLVFNYFGIGLKFIWLLGGLTLVGLLNELTFKKSFLLPAPKIYRKKECSNCGLCDDKCPQGIKISSMPVVRDIDCNLCTDCIYTCPKENILTVNNKQNFKYLAPVMVVFFIGISLLIAKNYEFKTISLMWGKTTGTESSFSLSGLKNIKCYGSSMALAGTLQNIEGILGLDTYAKSHSVTIYYDSKVISEKKVKESLFTPAKVIIHQLENPSGEIYIFEAGIYGLFDQLDFENLKHVLSEKIGIYSFETHYGEPVKTTIYFNNKVLNSQEIRKQIEKEYVIIKSENGEKRIDLNFKLENEGFLKESISYKDYIQKMYDPFDDQFNDYENYKLNQLSVFKFSMPEAAKPEFKKYFPYLVSHLSGNEGIVRFSTDFIEGPYGYVYYDPVKTNIETIKTALTAGKLSVFISETQTEEMDNPFHIKPEGILLKATDIIN